MHILIVEDDPHLRRGIVDLLQLEGFDCVAVGDGASAMVQLDLRAPDFCILDVMLPGENGYAVCRKIREQLPNVPILFLSACREELDRILGFECGADDYLAKPFSTRELVARIKAITRRVEAKPDLPIFTMGDLDIDPRALRAYREDRAIDLSMREIQLLQVLHRQVGLAVSRNDLFDACWGRDYMPNSRSLDQFVSALRHKIERDPTTPSIIRTVHGVGYRYERPS
jgi:two-component system, OmpR family, alkaline phosphatase synthesis response regulator PhoP